MSLMAAFPGSSGNSGTVLFTSDGPGGPGGGVSVPWFFTPPVGVSSVTVEGWGAGGPGASAPVAIGPGGGAGGYFKIVVAVTGGVTQLSGFIGSGGNPFGPTPGAATTLTSPACTANGGGSGIPGGAEGTGGTASGGSTNTTGANGGAVDTWDGGASPNGGATQNIQGANGIIPGGGGAGMPVGSYFGSFGASGRIRITVT